MIPRRRRSTPGADRHGRAGEPGDAAGPESARQDVEAAGDVEAARDVEAAGDVEAARDAEGAGDVEAAGAGAEPHADAVPGAGAGAEPHADAVPGAGAGAEPHADGESGASPGPGPVVAVAEAVAGPGPDLLWGPVDRSVLTVLPGGVAAVPGIQAAGVVAGLKPSGAPDLALVDAGVPVAVAATTTTNLVRAAPCQVTDEHVADGRARAVVVNAGNANACTGAAGLAAARRTCEEVARVLGCEPEEVVPLSTGIIGVPLDVDRLVAGLPALFADLADDAAAATRAARAITTTDTRTKQSAVEIVDDTGRCRLGGMAKGAGMIEPAMATMLTVLTTDAPLSGTVLRRALQQAVARTFNRISIDACGSTNDTVVLLATGRAPSPPSLAAFQTGLEAVCADLAHAIVADGEGTTKVCSVTVSGAPTEDDATALARAITASTLFRAAIHGADPNWGRILSAMGASGVSFDPDRVTVRCAGVTVCRFGTAVAFDAGQVAARLGRPEVAIEVDLDLGARSATLLCADLTPQYVADNAYYTT